MRIYRRVVIDIFGRRLQQFDGLRIVSFTCLSVAQHARQHDRAAFAARDGCLLRQCLSLRIISLGKEDLREQPHGVDIATFSGFLGPQRGLLAVTGAKVCIGQIILGTGVTRFSLFFVLTANLVGTDKRCKK